MSDGNRSERFPGWLRALAGLGLALAACALIAGLFYQIRYAQQAENGATEYARHTAYESYKPCRLAPLPKLNQCLADAQREYELQHSDNRRDYADLVAQQRSALWTAIMGLAALIGMALSAVGVWLVYTTFYETREANEIARDTAKRQLRAYIQPTTVFVEFSSMINPPRVTIVISNSGSTPAYDVQGSLATVDHIAEPDSFKCRFTSWPFRSKLVIGPNTEQAITGQLTQPRVSDSKLDWSYIVFGVIVYRDAFGHRRLTTYKYTISHNAVRRGEGRGQIAMTACARGNRSS